MPMLIPLQHALYMLGEEAVATTPGSHARDKRKVVGTMTLGVRDEKELDAALGKLRERAIIIGNGDEPG